MATTEIIRRGKNSYFYRSRSVRDGEHVRKVRKYLGKDLKQKELLLKEKEADALLHYGLNSLLTQEQILKLKEASSRFRQDIFTRQDLYEWFVSEFTYHSDAIEGNSITLKETALLLFDNIVPGNKHPREIYETLNHRKAIDYILAYKGKLCKSFVCTIQSIVTANTLQEESCGRYRTVQAFIRGAEFIPSKPKDVGREMRNLIAWYNYTQGKIHPIVAASYFHAAFEGIHPFADGNGRTGRLLLNWMLFMHNLPMITIRREERKSYFEAIENARIGDLRPMVNLVYARVVDAADKIG